MSVMILFNQRESFGVQLLVDVYDGPVADIQVVDDDGVEGTAWVENSVLGNPEGMLGFRKGHMAGNAEREYFDARRVLLVAVDDLVGIMLLQIAFRDDVPKEQAFVVHNLV